LATDRGCQMRLARPRRPEYKHCLCIGNEALRRDLADLLLSRFVHERAARQSVLRQRPQVPPVTCLVFSDLGGYAMAFELPSIQTLESLWIWAKDSIQTWGRAIGNLEDLVSRSDPDRYGTLVKAIQFSFFPITLTVLIEIPFNGVWSSGISGACSGD
jgi:hypothetical protein